MEWKGAEYSGGDKGLNTVWNAKGLITVGLNTVWNGKGLNTVGERKGSIQFGREGVKYSVGEKGLN